MKKIKLIFSKLLFFFKTKKTKEIEKLKEENKRIREKYITSRLTLEAVLVFIVPDNCRTMIEKTLVELSKK